jgi:solute carrier family 12 (potassium/chloride transporter), member 4/6
MEKCMARWSTMTVMMISAAGGQEAVGEEVEGATGGATRFGPRSDRFDNDRSRTATTWEMRRMRERRWKASQEELLDSVLGQILSIDGYSRTAGVVDNGRRRG